MVPNDAEVNDCTVDVLEALDHVPDPKKEEEQTIGLQAPVSIR